MTHTFTVNIDCGNDAFIEHDYTWSQTILDGNGNDVGRYAMKPGRYTLKEV